MKRILLVLFYSFLIVCVNAGFTLATPMISFEVVEIPGTTEINDLSSFTRTGNFSEQFHNNTGMTFTDFHFEFYWEGEVTGDGDGFFGEFVDTWNRATNFHSADFYMDSGTGIPHCTYFWVVTSGFSDNTEFSIYPTVPEPSSMLMVGAGLLVVAGFSRRKLKR